MFIPAKYMIYTFDTNNVLLDTIHQFESLRVFHAKNKPGTCSVRLTSGADINSFQIDGRVKVYRAIPQYGVDWYKEWDGIFVGYNPIEKADMGITTMTASALSLLDILARRIIAYLPDTQYSYKVDNAETIIKQFVEENVGASASNPLRLLDGNISSILIEDNESRGEVIEIDASFDNLLSVIAGIADSNDLVIDIQESNQENKIVFIVKDKILGNDRSNFGLNQTTGKNSAGYDPVVFTETFDNVSNLNMNTDRSSEKTAVIATGGGVGTYVDYAVSTNDDFSSIYGHKEVLANASNTEPDLESFANKRRMELRHEDKISFSPIQTPKFLYGRDYFHGDVISSEVFNTTNHLEIVQTNIEVNPESETIQLTMEQYTHE